MLVFPCEVGLDRLFQVGQLRGWVLYGGDGGVEILRLDALLRLLC